MVPPPLLEFNQLGCGGFQTGSGYLSRLNEAAAVLDSSVRRDLDPQVDLATSLSVTAFLYSRCYGLPVRRDLHL